MKSPTILLVDDSGVFRRTAQRFLERRFQLDVVGTAADAAEAVAQVAELRPAVVLLDWNLPRVSGIEAIPRIRAVHPSATIIMLTTLDGHYRDAALAQGADGFVEKLKMEQELLPEIDRALGACAVHA